MINNAILILGILFGVSVATQSLNSGHSSSLTKVEVHQTDDSIPSRFVGAVYVMTNDFEENSIVAFGRLSNGRVERIGEFRTGGRGAFFDSGDEVDPLNSAFALVPTADRRFLLAVNAGTNTIASLRVLPDFKLRLMSVRRVRGYGPVAVAVSKRLVYVANMDADGAFDDSNPPTGSLTGFRMRSNGVLVYISRSVRQFSTRPAALQFSPDTRSLVFTGLNAPAIAVKSSRVEEVSSFRVFRNGRLSARPVSVVTSTQINNRARRNLPSPIGFEIVAVGGRQFVVVTEFRTTTFDGSASDPQTGSVSVWRLLSSGRLRPIQLDIPVGNSVSRGQVGACWIEFSRTKKYFWVANTPAGTISAFSFSPQGRARLVEEVEARGSGPVDLWLSSDGNYLHQLFDGFFRVYRVVSGFRLEHVQTVREIPSENNQGIVAF